MGKRNVTGQSLRPVRDVLGAIEKAKRRVSGRAFDELHLVEARLRHVVEGRRSIFARRKPRKPRKPRTKKPAE